MGEAEQPIGMVKVLVPVTVAVNVELIAEVNVPPFSQLIAIGTCVPLAPKPCGTLVVIVHGFARLTLVKPLTPQTDAT